MNGKVCVVTGANTGIGLETAVGLAELGATTVITSRDPAKGEQALVTIRERTGSDDVHVVRLDLADLTSVKQCANEILERWDRLDVLVNNAGVVLAERLETAQGFEMTLGVNHLGPFKLTELLINRMTESAPARVVNVASVAHKFARKGMQFDDLMIEHRPYRGFESYGRSKLANILFTRELSRHLEGTGVVTHSLHPGTVKSEFAQGGDTNKLLAFGARINPAGITPAKGARTSVFLATDPVAAESSGGYWIRCKPAKPNHHGRDDGAALRLWEVSQQLLVDADPD